MSEQEGSSDEPREPHSGLLKQAMAECREKVATLEWVSKRYQLDNPLVKMAQDSVRSASFWVAEWAGVPLNFVDTAVVEFYYEGRVDIYFGGPNGPIDKENHLHAHYIFDLEGNLKQRRERNQVRKNVESR